MGMHRPMERRRSAVSDVRRMDIRDNMLYFNDLWDESGATPGGDINILRRRQYLHNIERA